MKKLIILLRDVFPMANFYSILEYDGVCITPYPCGWRGLRFLKWRPMQIFPYRSHAVVDFWVSIEYEGEIKDDLRELEIRFGNEGEHLVEAIHAEDNQNSKNDILIEHGKRHDDKEMDYYLKFPRTGKLHKIVHSKPIGSTALPLFLISSISGVIVGVIVGLILARFGIGI